MKFILLVHAAATLFMVGAIWVVQVVHYPLFSQVGRAEFPAYETAHSILITPIVGIPMLIEAVTALLLLADRPASIPFWVALVGVGLVGVVWVSTMVLQVPQHNVLAGGFNQSAYEFLVNSNWIRTLAWSARGGIALWMLAVIIN
jgi:hypothetical protein